MRTRQTGVALLSAVILIFAVSLILSNIFYRHQIDLSQASRLLHNDQALLIAISGEGWATELLFEDIRDNNIDHYGEIWAQALPLLPVEGGTLTGCLSDLQGAFNINSFKYYDNSPIQGELDDFEKIGFAKVWLNLLELLSIPVNPGRVYAIKDWIDADDSAGSWGAEQSDYEGLENSVVVYNDLFVSSSELSAVMGYTIEEVNKLMPWLSALPFQTPININTASVEILNSLSGNYGPAFIEAVLSGRPFSNVNDFYNQINEYLALWDPIKPGVGRANLIWPQHLISVNSDFFKLYLEAEIGEAKMELTSLLHRTKNAGINIISRDIRLVPKILPSSKPMSEIEALFSKKDEVSKTDQQNFQETNIIQSACSMMEFK